ncbi:hypothetical protein F7725_029128 [Dissostichus mawsoni]|uniref:Gelsolin-like domain-containing protein n=1 Tax=Dissostichus mawsoni TaxID=36200 RepID=A0A7J5XHX4_DISMA|nr:hypothetical protein F7725_029128 [Dissostichus mawsoni]
MEPRFGSKNEKPWSKFSRMMSDDNQDTFKSVSRKPGLQIWTINSADIHYWIGNSSSQDEQGAAAIFVTQLDEHLGGGPVQYREVQGNESPRFRSYFKNGLIYKKGGVPLVFTMLTRTSTTSCGCCTSKGGSMSQPQSFKWRYFLLDMGKAIVQWNGPQSNRGRSSRRCCGVLDGQDIREERGGRAQIGVVEGGDEKDSPELMKVLMAVLGPRAGPLKEALPDDRPDENSGNLVVQEVATQPLTQDLLHSSDCYILDQRGSSVMAKNYPSSTSVKVMTEGGESAMFKHMFKSWSDRGQTQGLGSAYSMGKIAKVEQVKFDVMELHARPELAAQQRMVDDGSGDVKVWRIEDLELAEVNPSTYGQFYGGDCYLAVDVDNKYNGAPVQVRVVMGKEPRHFLAIFKAKLVIFEGGARLFQVRGTNEMNTKATEVPSRASSLNTNDIFLLKTDHICFLWAMSDVLSKQDKQVVMEGQEPAEFWVNLGGKAPYASDKRLQKEEPPHSPRLFECSNQIGKFRMTEVEDFAQSDLDEEDVMLMDTWRRWGGGALHQYETKEAWNSAQDYLRTHPAGRDPDTPVLFDLNNTNLNKSAVGGGYGAPGGPASSPPAYRIHGGDLSPRPSTPAAPPPRETQPPTSVCPAEDYLSDKDFENLLGTTRADFKRLPNVHEHEVHKESGGADDVSSLVCSLVLLRHGVFFYGAVVDVERSIQLREQSLSQDGDQVMGHELLLVHAAVVLQGQDHRLESVLHGHLLPLLGQQEVQQVFAAHLTLGLSVIPVDHVDLLSVRQQVVEVLDLLALQGA